MAGLTVTFRPIAGTRATLGMSGPHSIVADRPLGVAGGHGLGLSGGELQALALGAGLSNALQICAERMGLVIMDLEIAVGLGVEDDHLAGAQLSVRLEVETGAADADRLLAAAEADSMISRSVARGFPVAIHREDLP